MQTVCEDGQLCLFGQDSWCGKMSQAPFPAENPRGKTSASFWRRSSELSAIPYQFLDLTPGNGNLLGESYWEIRSPWLGGSWTLNTGASPRDAAGSFLSQILLPDPPSKYYLSRKACLGILRRAEERGKALPPLLRSALMMQAGIIPSYSVGIRTGEAYHINQRNEGIDLGGVSGALMHTQNMQMQTFVTQPTKSIGFDGYNGDMAAETAATLGSNCGMSTGRNGVISFAANQRDEVRNLRDVAGALGAQPGMKQQTFVAAAFSVGAGPSAGSVGYAEERSPTLKASDSGTNKVPAVLCLNDQGGDRLDTDMEVSGTLRAQEHGHQPIVLYENHGIDCRYTGPSKIAPTVTARYGTGGNNTPLIGQVGTVSYDRRKIDSFRETETASTESARQGKDATDLILQEQDAETRVRLIRRLMPVECERLQGFPDGWTDVPGASDSARYKALGNSVAIPCVEYVLRGIAAVLTADRAAVGYASF